MTSLLKADDVALLLIDHQSGLFQTVHDIGVAQLRTNVAALTRAAVLLGAPVISTTSAANGPNGPLMPEIAKFAADHVHIPRNGEINAWDSRAFVEAVHGTGRKTLVIAGVWTSVCVLFPALSALAEGYTVHAVLDASGDISPAAAQAAAMRMAQAGVAVTSTNSVIAEMQQTWAREDALQFAQIYCEIAPNYGAVVESHYA